MTTSNAEKFISLDYVPQGREIRLFENTEVYVKGDILPAEDLHPHRRHHNTPVRRHGVLVLPDLLGWNSGRIRNVCDFLAIKDCLVMLPKLSGSSDLTPPAPRFSVTRIGDYFKALTFDVHLKPKIAACITFFHEQDIHNIAILGFNWGGWVAAHVLASELAQFFLCGVLAHPALELEERLYGGQLLVLFNDISKPVLYLKSKTDSVALLHLFSLLQHKLPDTRVHSYLTLSGDFLSRGDVSRAEVRAMTYQALIDVTEYIQQMVKRAEDLDAAQDCCVQQKAKLTMDSLVRSQSNNSSLLDVVQSVEEKVVAFAKTLSGVDITEEGTATALAYENDDDTL